MICLCLISIFGLQQVFGDMKSRHIHFSDRKKVNKDKAPSLVDLCVQTAIDNIRYIGNVGPVGSDLLERILPHCTVEQLMHIENATSDRDLSPETDKLWKKFYEAQFGASSVEMVEQKMKRQKKFNWRLLYQAKLKVQDEAKKQSVERLAQLYKTENARKQSRQIQICTKVPPSSKKRSFGGGFGDSSSFSNVKSNIMKKAKVEYSVEMKNRAAIRKVGVQQQRSSSVTRPQIARAKGVIPYSNPKIRK